MGIKPALGWLALLLFTTTAQAEGTREIFKLGPRGRPSASSSMVASPPPPVTPKTKVGPIGEGKAPLPAARPAAAQRAPSATR